MPQPIWNALVLRFADVLAQAGNLPAAPGTPAIANAETNPAANPAPNFQPYVFWAYGIVCALILLFTLWTLWQARQLRRKLEYLEERFERAHPGQN